MDEQAAIRLSTTKFWEEMDYRQRAKFQLFEARLCMPFGVFHEAVEKSLGRPVFTHEFGLNWEGLKREFLGDAPAPTPEEIIAMIPPRKLIVLRA